VMLGDHDRRVDGDLGTQSVASIPLQPGVSSLRSEDRILEHRLVEFEADLADMARLLVAEQVAGAADVEIVAGKLEARAETVEVAEHFETLLGYLVEDRILRRRQVGIGPQFCPPDSTPQLVELGEAEAIGAVN